MSNGYFQIGCTTGGMILKLVKPTDGGAELDTKEIIEYLTSHKIIYNAPSIAQGIAQLNSQDKPEQLVLLNKDESMEIEESYVLRASADKMKLTARFYAPSMRGKRITPTEFLNDLKFKNVKYGIKEDAIKEFYVHPQYCTDIVIAEGKEVVQGKHAHIEYYFETELNTKPELKEDGSVDFFHLNTYAQCQKGDIMARLFREEQGQPGMTVFGEPVRPLEVKKAILKAGRNLTISDDGNIMTADVNGHVSLVDGKVFLSDVMELDNVGPASGNIDFEGSVLVLGNVLENFSIKAKGNVEVRGVVEGAHIETEGTISIARGMKGMGKGTLKAGGNIIAKFIENADVSAAGYVETELILHSNVLAGTDVIVTGKKGFITGGRVNATNSVKVKTLGSDMGADTLIEVGADPNMKIRMQQLQKNIAEAMKLIEQNKPTIANFIAKLQSGAKLSLDQKMYMQTLLTDDKERKANLEKWKEELDGMETVLENTSGAYVEVSGDVYAGTKIAISDVSMVVKNTMTYCKFKKIDGDVKMTAL